MDQHQAVTSTKHFEFDEVTLANLMWRESVQNRDWFKGGKETFYAE